MYNINVGSRVKVSLASRSCIRGLQGEVIDIRPMSAPVDVTDELVIKADNGKVGYVRRKFATRVTARPEVPTSSLVGLEGHYVLVKTPVISDNGLTKCHDLYAFCTLVDGDFANVVFQSDSAWVETSNLEDLGKRKPVNFGYL